MLWIVPKMPIPPVDGARAATLSLIRGLQRLGRPVDLLVVLRLDEEITDRAHQALLRVVRSVRVVRIPIGQKPSVLQRLCAWLRAPYLPITVAPFATAAISQAIEQALNANGRNTSVVFDGLHPAAAWKGVPQKQRRRVQLIYRAHNRECALWEERLRTLPSYAFVQKALVQVNLWLMRRFEDSLVCQADRVAAISAVDAQKFGPEEKVRTVPYGTTFPISFSQSRTATAPLVFVGRLDWMPNFEGLNWILREIWPSVWSQLNGRELHIVGSGASSAITGLNQKNIVFRGEVRDISEVYRSSALLLAPIFFGSGVRVKIVEAVRSGCPVLSTEKGIEGLHLTPGSDVLVGESADEWREHLRGFSTARGEQLARAAFFNLKNVHDEDACAMKFLNLCTEASDESAEVPLRPSGELWDSKGRGGAW